MGDVRVSHAELMRFAVAVFSATGMSAADAETVAGVLVWANERGVDSHGVIRIPIYLKEIKDGLYKPTGKPTVKQLLPATFQLDCNRAPGPVCMMAACARAIELAKTYGIGMGLVSDPTHLGALGRYAQWIAEQGYAGMMFIAGLPLMSYHGAKGANSATSPIAIGIPAPGPEGKTLLLDMATGVASAGRIRQAALEGSQLPEGLAIDADGNPTTDPNKAATVLPLGGPKGSGLSLMFECLAGILAGSPIIVPRVAKGTTKAPIQNAMVIVFNVASFRAMDDYRRDVEELVRTTKALPRRAGFDELLLPGERGDREVKRRRRDGIPLPEGLYKELNKVAGEMGVAEFSAAAA
jgi:ureidoglycolate dehydrogenase (NAD+)